MAEKRKKRGLVERKQARKRQKPISEAERVIAYAAMGFTVRQIASELGRAEDFVQDNYAKQIQEGIVRGGAMVHKVIYEKALAGDPDCLSYFFWRFNHEQLDPLSDLVKDMIANERAPSRPASYRARNEQRQRDSKGRFKSEFLSFY